MDNKYLNEGLIVEFYSDSYKGNVYGVISKVAVNGDGWVDLLVATRHGRKDNELTFAIVRWTDVTIPRDPYNNGYINFLADGR